MSDDNTSDPLVAIVGGGLGGLALAIAFNRLKVRYRIYEATAKFAEIGAGISLIPNAVQALNLIDPKLWAYLEANGVMTYDQSPDASQLRIYCGQKRLQQYEYGDEIVTLEKFNAEDKGRAGAHRAQLLDEMIKHVPADCAAFNKRMVDIEKTTDSRVRISFSDGTSVHASAAVCCDGIHSRARSIVLGLEDPAIHPTFAGAYAYRALVTSDEADQILGTRWSRDGFMWVGEGRFIFQYPVDHGTLLNVVAVVVKPGSAWNAPSFQESCTKEEMLMDFKNFGEPLVELLSTTTFLKRWALFELPPVKTYTKGRVCLLGDAAHATTSHQGAGGSGAFEDAYVLAELLGDPEMMKDIPKALRAYDYARCERGNRIVSSSHEQGDIFTLQHSRMGQDLQKFAYEMRTRFDWLWGVDLQKDVEKAKLWFHSEVGSST